MIATACAVAIAFVVNWPIRATTDETAANFGTELLRQERPREAIPFLIKAVELLPGDAMTHRDLALAYLKSGDAASAAREYATVVGLEPGQAANHRELAVAAEAAGDRTAALSSLGEAARLDPSSASTQTKLGDILVRLEKRSEARSAYARALSLSVASPQETVALQVRIASLEVDEGKIADSLRLLEAALTMARASGQTAVANDVAATIEALRRRVGATR